jgi:hypothetical protein
MDENILAIRSADEAVSFGIIEKFDRSLQTLSIHTSSFNVAPALSAFQRIVLWDFVLLHSNRAATISASSVTPLIANN